MMAFTRRKLWFGIFLLSVFLAGVAAGALASRYVIFRGGPARFGMPPAPPSAAEIVDRMSRNLGLTSEQRSQLEAVFERNGDRLEAFRAQTRERFDALRQQIDAEITAILTPEQRAKFEEQRKQLQRAQPPGVFPGAMRPPSPR